MSIRHSLRVLVKLLRLQIARSLFVLTASWSAPTRVCSANSCSPLCIRRHRENRFRRWETRQRDGGRRGGRADVKKKKVEKAWASTDVVPTRSSRSDARWSCLVYPNYLLSRQVAECISCSACFTVTFYPPPHPALMTHCASKRRRNTSRDVVFIDVAEI